jgi:hypothetical protein
MDHLAQIREKRRQLWAAIADLDTAERVLLGLPTTNGEQKKSAKTAAKQAKRAESPDPKLPFAGMKIHDCAVAILQKTKRAMHYSEVAETAISGGYKSGRKDSDADRIRASFWATMKRNAGVFKALGKGQFELTEVAKQ